mgnify:CR=1 FL=1
MATINITKQGDTTTAYVTEFVVDSASDVANLPVQNEVATGSSCLCIATGAVYILDSTGDWVEI